MGENDRLLPLVSEKTYQRIFNLAFKKERGEYSGKRLDDFEKEKDALFEFIRMRVSFPYVDKLKITDLCVVEHDLLDEACREKGIILPKIGSNILDEVMGNYFSAQYDATDMLKRLTDENPMIFRLISNFVKLSLEESDREVGFYLCTTGTLEYRLFEEQRRSDIEKQARSN